ncbi:bifunctional inhibitor/lipid-transfer protein/seed storage 2S albumin superfamily protein [Tasmannia lanceolata]|uniref:bifunctional inhibitor/lipid-transfer protein/seed storage 2S albumin superfamily protein n=1 Tax=Tasmannia lanceolata TaxID=3420 RepID=UPI004063A8D6
MKFSSNVAIPVAILLIILPAVMVVAGDPPVYCGGELLALSPCLPYVSLAPNNVPLTVSSLCCKPIAAGHPACLCYIFRRPSILGFPLNTTRLLSLISLCPNATSPSSLQSLCQGSQSLPPLNNPKGYGLPDPLFSSWESGSAPPPTSSSSEPHHNSTTPSSPSEPGYNSTISKAIGKGRRAMLILVSGVTIITFG